MKSPSAFSSSAAIRSRPARAGRADGPSRHLLTGASHGLPAPARRRCAAAVGKRTSTQAQHIDANLVRGEIDPQKILNQYKSDNRSFTIAARFSGPVRSAYPEGPPPPEKKGNKKLDADKKQKRLPPHINQSKSDLNMIVFADTDLLTSRFWVRQQDFFGQNIQVPVSNNADFLVNSLDNLSGSQDLISLRSRGLSVRPFYRIRDLATAAEEKYRSTEQQLTAKLKDLQKKLSGLNMEEKPGAKAPVLTTEQTKAFQKFRSEMLDVRRQLREVQHNLRKDIEELDTALKILNIWTVPVVVAGVVGVGVVLGVAGVVLAVGDLQALRGGQVLVHRAAADSRSCSDSAATSVGMKGGTLCLLHACVRASSCQALSPVKSSTETELLSSRAPPCEAGVRRPELTPPLSPSLFTRRATARSGSSCGGPLGSR